MSEALLSVRDLSVEFSTYGRTNKVLHSVSLDVPAHSQVALVGESGSGKTVTMKAIMGLLREPPARITSGRIFYDGADLLTMPASERLKPALCLSEEDDLRQADLGRDLRGERPGSRRARIAAREGCDQRIDHAEGNGQHGSRPGRHDQKGRVLRREDPDLLGAGEGKTLCENPSGRREFPGIRRYDDPDGCTRVFRSG